MNSATCIICGEPTEVGTDECQECLALGSMCELFEYEFDGNKVLSRCTCGWESKLVTTYADAVAEHEFHRENPNGQ